MTVAVAEILHWYNWTLTFISQLFWLPLLAEEESYTCRAAPDKKCNKTSVSKFLVSSVHPSWITCYLNHFP